MALIKQSSTYTRMFFMVDSTDHVSPKTSLTVTVNISKAGGAFAAAGGTVSEVGNGWYKIALTSTDTNTLGELAYHCTATGADPTQFVDQIVAFDPMNSTNLGLSNIDATISSRAPETGGNVAAIKTKTDQLTFTVANKVDANTTHVSGTAQTARDLGANVDATISSRAPASTALSNAVWTDTKAGYIDVAISSRSTLTASDVWGYATRTLTSFGTLIADIWGYSTRTLTSFGTLVSDIWSYSTRTLTAFSTTLALSVWDVLETAITTANSIGLKVKTNLDATVSSRSTLTAADVWNYATRTLTSFGTLIADIWNYSTRTLTSFGTLVADIWNKLTSELTTTGSIGKLLADNVDATISSRATQTSVNATKTVVDLIEDILRNKMTVTNATGAATLYEDDSTTPKFTCTITDDATTTTRTRLV